MPKIHNNDDLSISLAAPLGWTYAPGDTIIGNIVRKTHLVTPDASLKLSLVGHTATKIEERHGNSNREYGAHWNLWPVISDEFFRGPLHIPEGAGTDEYLTSSFEVTIPTRPSSTLIKRHSQAQSFLSLDDDSVARQTIPGSFECGRYSSTATVSLSYGVIKYNLEAVLRYTRGGALAFSRATCPVRLRHTRSEPPLLFYETKRWLSLTQTVQSQRLEPGREDAPLSFLQKTQKFFGSSSVPKFTYKLEIRTPKTVQLDNALPIPFTMKAIPLLDQTSESIRSLAKTIQIYIHTIKLSIDARTDLRAPGTSNVNNVHYDQHIEPHAGFFTCNPPMALPVGQEREPVDIGRKFELWLRNDGLQWASQSRTYLRPRGHPVYPDFMSYLINHCHWVSWEIMLGVVGERQKVTGRAELRVLAAD
ncbi:uncharacterized protein ACHE_50097S [Aspergillus chevalieri]|uniref:Arrestin-like N-terminal domain-containing protein n=1 Tax=Aspergillus chevalieri TaxID=182096 RepID=A0A7R7VRS8_ASPCH|nr:uncharacterized protein ACHE_50097S [Aspergillus chevalieri]BCR88899.1 hypothetical protein ACHE_50097S [Aspergillus chevalieri]